MWTRTQATSVPDEEPRSPGRVAPHDQSIQRPGHPLLPTTCPGEPCLLGGERDSRERALRGRGRRGADLAVRSRAYGGSQKPLTLSQRQHEDLPVSIAAGVIQLTGAEGDSRGNKSNKSTGLYGFERMLLFIPQSEYSGCPGAGRANSIGAGY